MTSLHSTLANRLSFGKQGRALGLDVLDLRTKWRSSLATMNRLQRARQEDLQAFQVAQVRQLLRFAIAKVPFYSRKLKQFDVNSLRSLSDLSKLAQTRKDELRVDFGETTAYRKSYGIRNFTSGSTGKPFAFYEDKRSLGITIASRFLLDAWTGVGAGEPRVRISAQIPRFWPKILFNEVQIPLLSVTPSRATRILDVFRRHRPELLISPPTAAAILCEHPIPDHSLRAVITTAVGLPESLRRKLESRWGTLVLNRYGLREISGYVAQECKVQGGLHINSPRVIVEIVRDGHVVSPGEQGEIVITDLNNYVMPFIRYATGDMAEQGGLCPCGNALPLLKKIIGRSMEYLRAKNGDLIPLSAFTDSFGDRFLNEVTQFRFIDRGVGKLTAQIVPAQTFSQTTRRRIEEWLGLFADDVEIEIVPSISWDRSWNAAT